MEELQLPLLWAMLSVYVGSFMLYAFSIWAKKPHLKKIATLAVSVGLFANVVLVVLRAVLIKGIPLNNGFEFGMCFTMALIVTFLIVQWKFDLAAVGVFVLPIVIVLCGWMLNIDMRVMPIAPALRSYWLSFHVSAAVIAYGTFALSFALSIAYLVKENTVKKQVGVEEKAASELKVLDEVSYKMVFIGLPFLTIMLITGAVWAEYAWGSFWSWDPKETWALITWLVYAIYLHARFMKGWKGRRAAVLSILGFAAVIFTFVGVSYLLPGMHSYLAG